jgi:uncharacterized metal-binding protein YceD (DUF177 family)
MAKTSKGAGRAFGGADVATGPLDWTIDTSTMAGHGVEFVRSATADERARVVAALGLISCETLAVKARIDRPGDDVYFVTTRVEAKIEQPCVVTLEPVPEKVDLRFTTEYRPAARIAEAEGDVDLDDPVEVEPLVGFDIPIGRVVFEELLAGIEPYPRKDGVAFTGLDGGAKAGSDVAKESPFAVLARLKPKDGDKNS